MGFQGMFVFDNKLTNLEFFDQNNTSILKVGNFGPLNIVKIVKIVLEDSERIVGFKSGSRGKKKAWHFDSQLIIGRMV